jgi:hypothetical protein
MTWDEDDASELFLSFVVTWKVATERIVKKWN